MRRKDMRDQILQVAFELFTRQGYDKTSLREIAERLEVTKAALYYHFTSKEEILSALVAGIPRMFDELIAWSESLPRSVESRKEILRRLASWTSEKLNPVLRFVQANSTAIDAANVDGESMHEAFTPGLRRIAQILVEPGAELTDQVRAIIAVNLVMMGRVRFCPTSGRRQLQRWYRKPSLTLPWSLSRTPGAAPNLTRSRLKQALSDHALRRRDDCLVWVARCPIKHPPSLLVGGLLCVAEVRDGRTELGIEERDDAQQEVGDRAGWDALGRVAELRFDDGADLFHRERPAIREQEPLARSRRIGNCQDVRAGHVTNVMIGMNRLGKAGMAPSSMR